MKKLITLLILISIFGYQLSLAQYYSFPDGKAIWDEWSVELEYGDWFEDGWAICGDTLYEGIEYKKVYSYYKEYEYDEIQDEIYVANVGSYQLGLIREDEQKKNLV